MTNMKFLGYANGNKEFRDRDYDSVFEIYGVEDNDRILKEYNEYALKNGKKLLKNTMKSLIGGDLWIDLRAGDSYLHFHATIKWSDRIVNRGGGYFLVTHNDFEFKFWIGGYDTVENLILRETSQDFRDFENVMKSIVNKKESAERDYDNYVKSVVKKGGFKWSTN